jgi:ribosome-associated protein
MDGGIYAKAGRSQNVFTFGLPNRTRIRYHPRPRSTPIATTKSKPAVRTPKEHTRKLAVLIAQLMADTKCSAVRVLDCGSVSPVCDYLIIANGTSPRQMRSVADEIEELAEQNDYKPRAGGKSASETWIALDLYDIVVHLFTPDARVFYDLDNLWGDAKDVEWKPAAGAKSKD